MSFYHACRISCIKTIRNYLNKQNFNVNTINDMGFTGLHYAAHYGRLKVVKILITQYNADTEIKTRNKSTAFLLAVYNNRMNVVKYMLTLVDISIADAEGYNALHKSIYNNNLNMIELLLSTNNGNELWINPFDKTTDCYQYDAISYALKLNRTEIYEYLLIYNCKFGTQ